MAAAAARHGLLFGTAVNGFVPWSTSLRYRSLLAREFSILTPENEMKWAVLHPERATYRFEWADCLAGFAQAHDQKLFAGPLVWHGQMPAWVVPSRLTRDGAIALLREHITTVVGHYRQRFPDTVRTWEVVNEAIEDAECADDLHCGLRHTVWYDTIGPDYVDLAFQIAHEADPTAALYYNEIAVENATVRARTRREVLARLLEHWRHDHIPVTGIGLQMHVPAGGPGVVTPDLGEWVKRIAASGFDVSITEMDVVAPHADAPNATQVLAGQAAVFRLALKACLDEPRCKMFMLWGFSDRASWLHGLQATPMDEDFAPKPAWAAMLAELQDHPVTPRAASLP